MIGKTLHNRYEIIQQVGSGGFGDTYLALDLHIPVNPKPKCIVKHLKPKDPSAAILPVAKNLFDREAKVLYRLGNACSQIPKLLAHFEDNGEFYLVQEFIEGHDLTKEIIPGVPKSENVVFKLLKDILEVLSVVHQHNVIHRDIKPQNLMRRHLDGKIILIDFGAVKEIEALEINAQGQTSLTIAIGSPGYMPSEQATGRPRLCSDIYAVGIIAIQALTGLTPHEIKENSKTGEITWRGSAQVNDSLAEVIDRMVRDHFSMRYQSATEALEALMTTVNIQPLRPMLGPVQALSSPSSVSPPVPSSTQSLPSPPIAVAKQQGLFTKILLVAGFIVLGGYALWKLLPHKTTVPTEASQPIQPTRSIQPVQPIQAARPIQPIQRTHPTQPIQPTQLTQPSPRLTTFVPIPVLTTPEAYNNRGLDYYNKKDYERAIAYYNQALELNPNYATAYYNRGLVYHDKKDYDRAIADYNQALTLDPSDSYAYYNRGLAYYDKKDYERAIADYNQALILNPDYVYAYNNRGLAYYHKKDYERAIANYNQALMLNPHYARAYYNRGLVYHDKKDYERAIADYNQALKLDPNYTEAYKDRAKAYKLRREAQK